VTRNRPLCFALAAAIALVASGCGGDDVDTATGASADEAVERPAATPSDVVTSTTSSATEVAAEPSGFGQPLPVEPPVDSTQVPPPSPEDPPQGSMVPEPPPTH
jgi:hypothetical protein